MHRIAFFGSSSMLLIWTVVPGCTWLDPSRSHPPSTEAQSEEPCVARTGLTPEFVDYIGGDPGRWVDGKGITVAFADEEDGVIYTTAECARYASPNNEIPALVLTRDIDACIGELSFSDISARFECHPYPSAAQTKISALNELGEQSQREWEIDRRIRLDEARNG